MLTRKKKDGPRQSMSFGADGVAISADGEFLYYCPLSSRRLHRVPTETLAKFGAVSRETVLEMVSGALITSGASMAVAVTGIAGPTGGTPDKPVGVVWVAWKRRGRYPTAEVFHFEGDREAIRRQTVAKALAGLMNLLD